MGRAQLRRLWPLGLAETLADTESLGPRPAPAPALVRLLEEGASALEELPEVLSVHPRAAEIEGPELRELGAADTPLERLVVFGVPWPHYRPRPDLTHASGVDVVGLFSARLLDRDHAA